MEQNSVDGWRRTLNAARTIKRFCDEKIGWNRIGVVLSIAILTFAAVALYRNLRDIDLEDLMDALRDTDRHDVWRAGLCVAGGYFTLTFYDLFALRTIGRGDVPYRVAALAGFTSYSVGHNIGASVLTGGAVRYRIYSAWDLDAIAVAKVCFIAGLTFWLGNATVLGLGITFAPQAATAIDQLPPWINRAAAILILSVLGTYVAWVWRQPRTIGRSGWQVKLPDGPLTLLQIGIGIIDLAFCALAMFMLVPDDPNIGFVSLAVIFVSSTLLGFSTSGPGGITVFVGGMPGARRLRRLRRRHAGRAVAVRRRGSAGWAAGVSVAVLRCALCDIAGHPRHSRVDLGGSHVAWGAVTAADDSAGARLGRWLDRLRHVVRIDADDSNAVTQTVPPVKPVSPGDGPLIEAVLAGLPDPVV